MYNWTIITDTYISITNTSDIIAIHYYYYYQHILCVVHLETFTVDYARTSLVILSLGDPHLLESGQG